MGIYYLSISLTGLPCHREPSIVLMSMAGGIYLCGRKASCFFQGHLLPSRQVSHRDLSSHPQALCVGLPYHRPRHDTPVPMTSQPTYSNSSKVSRSQATGQCYPKIQHDSVHFRILLVLATHTSANWWHSGPYEQNPENPWGQAAHTHTHQLWP